MRNFLGTRLESILKEKEVLEEGTRIKVVGPLSNVFTEALNEQLARKENEVVPVVESFTDPVVIAEYLKSKQPKAKPANVTVYAYSDSNITDRDFVDVSAAIATADSPEEVIVCGVDCPAEGVASHRQAIMREAFEKMVAALGAKHCRSGNGLVAAIESHRV